MDPLGQLTQLGPEIASSSAANELGDLIAGESGEAQPHHVVGAPEVGECLRERLRHVGLGVTERCEHEHARVSGSTRQVAQEEERRGVGPVPVLEHEQRRPTEGDALEEIGHGRVQTVTLGIRIGLDRRREIADPEGQIREEACELATSSAERLPQLGRIDGSRQMVERLDERPVRRAHDGVTRAVENQGAVPCHLAGELPDEAALTRARARLPAARPDGPHPPPSA